MSTEIHASIQWLADKSLSKATGTAIFGNLHGAGLGHGKATVQYMSQSSLPGVYMGGQCMLHFGAGLQRVRLHHTYCAQMPHTCP